MTQSLQLTLLNTLGYALFERTSKGLFRLLGERPPWIEGFLPGEAQSVQLAEVFPFLEVFLLDAEELWSRAGGRRSLRSDYWTQLDLPGNELHLRASAVLSEDRHGERGLLLIESAAEDFGKAQALLHHAHESSLAYEKIAKLSRELEHATNVKSEFVARMSHEIRTPLNALLGMAELLWETPLSAEQRKYVNVFRRTGDNLLKIVNDVLDFSKVEAGQLELEKIPFDLTDILNETIEVLAARAQAKGLQFGWRMSQQVPTHLSGDAGRLRQVLLNLLGNAIKFTERGEVALLVGPDTGSLSAESLHFVVSDTGIGIPADRVGKIFESFTQADVSTARRFGGTGLGLAISRRFVELMGGRIWVDSTPGVGTQMHFTLPFGAGEMAPVVHPEANAVGRPAAARTGTLRILLVDDSEDNRLVVCGYLKDGAYLIDEAENGFIGLEKFKQNNYDVVLTDVEMPLLDGFSATREMRAYEEQRGVPPTPILALTAHAFKDAEQKSRAAGFTGHLRKPIRKAALLAAIRPYEPDTVTAIASRTPVEAWLKPIIPGYLEKRRQDVSKLRVAFERRDYEAVRLLGHQMAGTGGSYGFDAITELGSALEESAESGDAARMQAGIEQLDSYLGKVEIDN